MKKFFKEAVQARFGLLSRILGLAVVGLWMSAQAQPGINGSISFVGGATLDGPLATATAFTGFTGPSGSGSPVVLGSSTTGDFAGVPGNTAATFSLFTFNPAPVSVNPLWSFNYGGKLYSFSIASITIDYQSATFLNISGTGMAHIDGFTDTLGSFSITDTRLGSAPVVTFGASFSVVPEPTSAALLLLGGVGIALVSRRRK